MHLEEGVIYLNWLHIPSKEQTVYHIGVVYNIVLMCQLVK